MFDGSIKPPRVIRLSGASFLAQNPSNRRTPSRFDVYSSTRNRAGKRIRDFLQSRLLYRRDISSLKSQVPSCVEAVELFFKDPTVVDGYSADNVVSYHPVCRLTRLISAIFRTNPDPSLASVRKDCLKYLVNWHTTQNTKYSFTSLTDNDGTKLQFILLVSRFIKSFFNQKESQHGPLVFEPGILRLSNDPLSEDDILFSRLIKIVVSLFPYRTVCEINAHCGLTAEWYPNMLRRLIVNGTRDDFGLLELHRFLNPLIADAKEAFNLLIRFWSDPGLKAVSNLPLVAIVKSTVHENFLIGCSGIGDATTLASRPSNKLRYQTEALVTRLLKACSEKLPMEVALNTGKMNAVEANLRAEIELDSLDTHLNMLHFKVNDTGVPAYRSLFFNLLALLERLVELDVVAQKTFVKHLESILNALFVAFYHFPEPPNLYHLQTKLFWTKLLCLPNLRKEVVLMIIQLLLPLHQKAHFLFNWQDYVVHKVTRAFGSADVPQQELDPSVANVLLSGSAVPVLLGLFRNHLTDCCGNNFLALFTHFDEEVSNYSAFASLWKTFCLLINHALKIMYDGEIIQMEEGVRALMSVEDAVWVSKILNYMFWYKLNNRKMAELEFRRSNFYPHAQVCRCNVEVRVPGPCHYPAPTAPLGGLGQYSAPASYNFSDECVEIGLLARKFNERFYRLTGTNSDVWIIPDAEHALMQSLSNDARGELLRILDYIPHTISFKNRLQVFYNYISKDKLASRNAVMEFIGSSVYIIRRQFIVEDGLSTLGSLNDHQLKQVFRVLFVDENGIEEQGVDGGGLFKEFLITLCTLIFDPTYGIFEEIPEERSYYPCPHSGLIHENHLELFCFIGKIVGKALYEQILIEPVLSRLILNLILKRRNTLDDLKLFDGALYRNLTSLRRMSADEISSLGLTFSCTQACFGSTFQEDLVENGRNIRVTRDNVESFIHQFSNFKCNRLIEAQCSAFLQGLSGIIPLEWLQMFSPAELELLISGSSDAIDVADLRRNTVYAGGFDERSATILWFWEILVRGLHLQDEYDNGQRSSFLWFVTCCKRSPLMGFKQLQPPFCVHKEPDPSRLPSVSTCLNLLKLPECVSKDALRVKLRDAMSLSKGFGLH